MKKFKWKQIGSAVIAAALMGSMVLPIVSQAQEEIARLQAGSTNQTSTAPEQIMLNNYNGAKRSENFNNNWKFYLGEAGNAQVPEFDDSGWDRVTLPHDYSIDQKYNPKLEGESGYLPGGTGWYRKSFTVNESLKDKRISIDFGGVYMNATVYLNGKQLGTHPYGYTPFSFDITNDVKLGEENVLAVKVEHKTPSSRFYSGSGIYRDVDLVVTDAVHVDKNGTKVETPKLSEHANGKNVPVNIKTTVVNNTETDANVKVQHTVYPKGGSVEQKVGTFTTGAETVSANKSAVINADFTVDGVSLWTVKSKNPQMYVVRTEVLVEDKVVDTYETDYGFRFFNFDKDKGFSLNGENMKLKGVCMHHDQGALGAVANDRSTERQVEIMKNMGVNSIRVTHNPASRELIDACNKHGILLVEEAFDGWVEHKNGNSQDYAGWFNTKIKEDNQIIGGNKDMTWAQFDLTAMIKRGQNAPSIIMWSLGNEMWEGTAYGYNGGFKTAQDNLIKWASELDKTRPVTTGDNKLKGGDLNAKKLAGDLHTAGGAVGLNYASGTVYDQIHRSYPEWRMYGSETASAVNSRGIYKGMNSRHDYGNYSLTSYDTSAVIWGAVASDAWYQIIQRDYLAGEYVWTGFDYIGEPTPWNDDRGTLGSKIWPAPKNSYFGIVDTAGLPKDTYYFYQSQWNDDVNTLHILPAWNEDVVYKNAKGEVPVVVYSDAAKVELWFKDAQGGEPRLIGTKAFTTVESRDKGYTYQMYQGEDKSRTEHENLYLTWMVPYQDGTIFAKAFDAEGNEIKTNLQGRTSVTTAGAAKKLEAKADRTTITADGQDLSYITVSVTDEKGNLVPDAANKVSFKVTGDGVLAGVDNGQQIDHQSFRDNNRKAFSGQLVGIVRSTKAAGTINVEITADNLQKQNITITTQTSATNPESEKAISSVTMPKNYYVKVGVKPELPNQLEVTLTDGTKVTANVAWKEIPADKYGTAGSFTVSGTITAPDVDKTENVYVNINMIDTVAAILNYSTTTTVGVDPQLPKSRPAVKADGTVLTASFPVKWDDAGVKYNQAGIVEVKGNAEVFGVQMPVTATIRVQETQYTVGENVAPNALKPLIQDVQTPSDSLEAVNDGSREVSLNPGGGVNKTLWSNYHNTKDNKDTDAEITFKYATQETLNQVKVFFYQDSHAASYPDPNTTEIYVSTTGEGNWNKVTAEETIGETKGGVREYTYDFAPTGAVAVKLRVVNNSTRKDTSGKFTCTAIAEIELYRANASELAANKTAKLESLAFGEVKAPASALEAGSWSTSAKTAENMSVKTADNASVTVLPAMNGMIRMILESEDNKTQKTFIVNLDADPTDASQDYAGNVAYKAGSAQTANNNGIEKAFDRDEQSYWHTAWGAAADAKNRWVEMALEEPQYMTGLRYLPRPAGGQGSSNGNVLNYRIEVRNSETEDWQPVKITDGTSEWSKDGGWKLAKFATPVEAKYVRFVGVRTHDDTGSNMHMNAAEIRLKVTEKPTVTGLQIEQNPTKNTYLENEKFEPAGLVVALKYSDGSKGQRVEYNAENAAKFTFEPNLETALVKGQDKISVTFEGQKADIAIKVIAPESLEVYNGPSRMQYTEGEHFNPAGLEVQIKYSDGTLGEKVVYSTANAGEFTFEPDLNTALTAGTHMATVTYQGLKANLGNITVNEKTPVDPEPPVDPEMPVVTEITVSTPPAKTEYKAGEKFDPTGLVLNVTIEDGTTGEVPYRPETAEFFSFEPGLDTALTAGTQKVTVTFGGKTAEITISVKNADGTTPNGGSDGTTTPNGNGPAQTGDTFNSGLVIGICVVSAVAICVIVVVLVKKNKKNKN